METSHRNETNGLKIFSSNKMFENKLMKTVSDAAVITEIKAGYRWIAKKVTKRVDDF